MEREKCYKGIYKTMKAQRMDLREHTNQSCVQCVNRKRKEILEDGLCPSVKSILDNLPVRCVGDWAQEKVFRLIQYFGIFAAGMKNKWGGLNYIEICSGPGRCITRDNQNEIDGTALAIINHKIFGAISAATFIDNNDDVVKTLNSRIQSLGASVKARAVHGDYSDPSGIVATLDSLPKGYLNLCFIDPTHCDVPFATVQKIIGCLKNVDLIINVATGTDFSRNVTGVIMDEGFSKAKEKYESFLGSPGFFQRKDVVLHARNGNFTELRRLFRAEYEQRFSDMGFSCSAPQSVRHYYDLVFFTRNPTGLSFWNKACQIEPDGQRMLF